MLLISYDISNNKLRTRFSTYIKKYGYRLQYSVYEIKNSKRILENIIYEIKGNFEKKFTQEDSIMIFHFSKQCKKYCFGYAKNEDDELLVIVS